MPTHRTVLFLTLSLSAACSGEVVDSSRADAGGAHGGNAGSDVAVNDSGVLPTGGRASIDPGAAGGGARSGGGNRGGGPLTGGAPGIDGSPIVTTMNLEIKGIASAIADSVARILAVGNDETGAGMIFTTKSGGIWDPVPVVAAPTFVDVEYGNGVFVALGFDSNSGSFVTLSKDGVTFDAPLPFGSAGTSYPSAAFGSGVFVVTDSAGTVYTSANGTDWSPGATEPGRLVTFGAGHFAYTGDDGLIYVSEKGDIWTPADVNGNTNYTDPSVVTIGDALVARSMFQCCFGEDPSSNGYGEAVSRDGIVWNFVDYGHTNATTQIFATNDACFSTYAATFDTASGPNTPCTLVGDVPVLRNLTVETSLVTGQDVFVGGYSGIVESHDGGKTWMRSLGP